MIEHSAGSPLSGVSGRSGPMPLEVAATDGS
jgi:hypothetical protein